MMSLLEKVKKNLSIMVDDKDLDANIQLKIDAVIGYLKSAGATIDEENPQIVSCVSIGVNDLLNNKAGETKFSPAFNLFALQICRG